MGGGAIAMLVVVTTYASEVVEGKKVTAKPLLAGGVLGLMLTIIESISPRVGHAFGVLVIVAALATNGADALKALGIVANGPTAAAPVDKSGGGNWAAPTGIVHELPAAPVKRGGATGPIVTG